VNELNTSDRRCIGLKLLLHEVHKSGIAETSRTCTNNFIFFSDVHVKEVTKLVKLHNKVRAKS